MSKNGLDLVKLYDSLQSDTHVAIDFCEIKLFPSLIRKKLTSVWLVFENKNRRILKFCFLEKRSQPAITCSKLIIEPLEQGVKYVQS